LLDQEFGLLAYAPMFVLAIPGLGRLARERPRAGLAALLMLAAVAVTAGSWHMWRGGWNPPARFLVPVVPVLALGASFHLRRGLGAAAALLVGWGLFTGLTGAAEPSLVHRDRDRTAPLFRHHGGADEWARLLPSYVLGDPERHRLALVWGGLLVLGLFRRGQGPASAAGLACATAALVASAGLASSITADKSEGRNAVRTVGQPVLRVPGWSVAASSEARWTTRDLEWGPTYEPHRFPSGVRVGGRLPLREGKYKVVLEAEMPPGSEPPLLEVRGEGRPSRPRASWFEPAAEGWRAHFVVLEGERAVSLLLKGGGPFLLGAVRLSHSTF
jgi:hypothetical protein